MDVLDSVSLDEIIQNSRLFNLMLRCLKDQNDRNGLLFLKAVQKYKNETNKYVANALLIQQRYLLNGAYCEINVAMKNRKAINQLLDEYETREEEINGQIFRPLVKLIRPALEAPIEDAMVTEEWIETINDQKKRSRINENLAELQLF